MRDPTITEFIGWLPNFAGGTADFTDIVREQEIKVGIGKIYRYSTLIEGTLHLQTKWIGVLENGIYRRSGENVRPYYLGSFRFFNGTIEDRGRGRFMLSAGDWKIFIQAPRSIGKSIGFEEACGYAGTSDPQH